MVQKEPQVCSDENPTVGRWHRENVQLMVVVGGPQGLVSENQSSSSDPMTRILAADCLT